MLKKTGQFLSEVTAELKKVSWPTRPETIASTGIVLVVVFVIGTYLGVIDFALSSLITALLG